MLAASSSVHDPKRALAPQDFRNAKCAIPPIPLAAVSCFD
jgi:hypothetical protein